MSGERMLFVVFLALAVSSQSCTQFTCGTNISPACYTYSLNTTDGTSVGVSSKCSSGTYCPFSINEVSKPQSCAVFNQATTYTALAGEKCNATYNCLPTLNCTSKGYCQGVPLNHNCTAGEGECEPGLYCNSLGVCVKQISSGGACTLGHDYCDYGHECNNSVCIKMYSISVGKPVDINTCSANVSILCSTANCYRTSTTTAVCTDYYVRQGSYVPCTTCTGINKYKSLSSTMDCACGLSGSKYCPGFSGDTYQKKSFSKSKSYHLGSDIKKCSVVAGNRCMRDHWSKDDFYEYNYYTYMSTNHYVVYKASKCVYENLLSEYVGSLKDYESAESSSSSYAGLLAVSAFLIGLLA